LNVGEDNERREKKERMIMRGIFDKVMSEKMVELKDICEIEPFLDGLFQNVFQKYSVLSVNRDFPFTSGFKNVYIQTIEEQFKKDRESIVETVLHCGKEQDQLFETEVLLGEGMGYIRYLFPVSYAKALIKQGEFKSVQMEVETLYQFTKHIEIEDDYIPESKEPIIVLSYPQSSPNFFVLDGNHRVYQAHKKKEQKIESYMLPEGAINLLAPQRLFVLLSKIHLNLTLIGLYMVGDIILAQLKEWYKPIADEEWIS
jgi:hypothetical protein